MSLEQHAWTFKQVTKLRKNSKHKKEIIIHVYKSRVLNMMFLLCISKKTKQNKTKPQTCNFKIIKLANLT